MAEGIDQLKQLEEIQARAIGELETICDEARLEAWRITHLGRNSAIMQVFSALPQFPKEIRPQIGQAANRVKQTLESGLAERAQVVKETALQHSLTAERLDVTMPGRQPYIGRAHIVTQTIREIVRILGDMGFQVYRSPEVETDENNFEMLNIPAYHPARDMWDTFWVSQDPQPDPAQRTLVMRTHTSPGQIRAMRERCPQPIRVILPGKCYRYEQVTASHDFQFYQIEGLAVGRNIRLTDLIGTLEQFARKMYGAGRFRVRGSYFPFTEPSIEADMSCILCDGKGCAVCKYTGWLEAAGAGMVHPVVLRNGGYDPDVFSGFAFGMGVERPAMLRHRINNIRHFYSNYLRFLGQFG